MQIKVARRIYYLLSLITLICFVIGIFANIYIVGIFSILLAVVALLFNLAYIKCPRCGKHLGRESIDYCAKCGEILDETNGAS